MIRNLFAGLTLCAALIGCGESSHRPSAAPEPADAMKPPPPPEQSSEPVGDPRVDSGGTSGSEGSALPCETRRTTLETSETVSPAVGVSASRLLELANRERQVSLRWPKLDAGPSFESSAATAMLSVSATGLAVEIVCDDPNYPDEIRPQPVVELPVAITLRTDDGALDERIEGTLRSESRERAYTYPITLEPEALGGTIGAAVTTFYASNRSVLFEFSFGPNGARGWMGGPFSPHAQPCAYTAYVHWPADDACLDYGGEPTDGVASIEPYLERVNRSFELRWSDRHNERNEVQLEVQLGDGPACRASDWVTYPVRTRITTGDARVDVVLPGSLTAGPSGISPWPEHLRHVEPFYVSLVGSFALDADQLREHVGIEDVNVSAAIVSFYVGSPSGVDSAELEGMIRVVPIDRTGFASPLPTVPLPGGDSEHCFSAVHQPPILRGELALH